MKASTHFASFGWGPRENAAFEKSYHFNRSYQCAEFLGDKIQKSQSAVFLRLFSLYMCAKLKADMTEGEYRITLLLSSPLYHVLRKQ